MICAVSAAGRVRLLSGIAGAIAWQLIWGALALLAQRLHDRAARRWRIAQARERVNG